MKKLFAVCIKVGSTNYLTHGVTSDGRFGNLPYMNGDTFPVPRGYKRERIDLMTDRYLRGKYSFEDIERITEERAVVNIPAATMHTLFGNENGDLLIVEPGYGSQTPSENYAVLTNFPIMADLDDFSNPFYGKEHYDTAISVLESSDDDFSAADAMDLLCRVKAEGKWGTKLSFVYSRKENAVYYCINGDFSDIKIHRFSN